MAQQNSGFEISDFLSALARRRMLLFIIAIPIVLVALVLSLGLPDVYRSTALIEINDGTNSRRAWDSASPRDEPSYADQYVSSLAGVILRDENLRNLLQENRLYESQDSDPQGTIARLKRDISVQIVTAPILDPRTGREREVVTAFTASYESRDPQNAQRVAVWLADEFTAANRRHYFQNADSTAGFYREEADRLGEVIAAHEQRLADFKNANFGRLPELTEINLGAIDRSERDLTALQQQARSLRQERVFLTAQLEQALVEDPQAITLRQLEDEYRRRAALYDQSHPDIVSLRRQIENARRGGPAVGASLQSQLDNQRSILAEVRQRYSDEHPDVRRIQQTISALEARIASGERADAAQEVTTPVVMQLKTQIAAIDTQLASIDARSNEVRLKMSEMERNLIASPEVEREYQTLSRDLSTARAKYEELLKRQFDAQISGSAIAAGHMDEFRIVQQPLVPAAPAKPNRLGIFVIGIVLAMVIAVSVTLAVEVFDPTVRGTRDIREMLSVSALAAIPTIQNSVSRRRRFKQALTATATLFVGVSVLLYVVRGI